MPRVYNVATFFSGSGFKTLGILRARGADGSRFRSIGAFDIDPVACADYQLLTGTRAQVLDLGTVTPEQLRERCDGVPDFVVGSPPCKAFSGCLPEKSSKTEHYQALNRLALRAVDLAIETWDRKPKIIALENVPRMLTRGAELLEQMKVLLRKAGYEVDLRVHDCGKIGGLAQKRERVLLMARLRSSAPSHLLMPPDLGLRSMASVLWELPVPVPGSTAGGPHHRLPQLAPINWLRLATIPAGCDWRAIPGRVHVGLDVEPRLPVDGDRSRHAGKYGVQRDDEPSHTVIAEARTGKGWADVADPRLAARPARQNGGYGVNDSQLPSHSVLAEGSVRNTWGSLADPRLECSPRAGTMGVMGDAGPSKTIIGTADIHNSSSAVADPRSHCHRREDSIGVSDPELPYKTAVIGHQKVENSPSSVADPRLDHWPRRGSYGVTDRATLFAPDHELVAGQEWTGDRDSWTAGEFWLLGPRTKFAKGGRPTHMVIRAPDGTVHRPMTTAELMRLQGCPIWHIPGDPTEIPLWDPRGQFVQLEGSDSLVREHVGNAVPVQAAQAIGGVILGLLDLGAEESFTLSSAGVWVQDQPEVV
jgi:site-specific DNA-cytosine methylase